MNLGKLCCDVNTDKFLNFPNIDKLVSLSFHHPLLFNFITTLSKDHQKNNMRIFWTTFCICHLLQCIENHSSIGFFAVAVKILCDNTSSPQRQVTNKLKRCCLFLILWENANYSLMDSVFCFRICKCTLVSDCPTSTLEQFLALIPRYTPLTYSIDNGFKLLLGRVNFVTVLNHSLYVSLTLIALMTYIYRGIHLVVFIHKPCFHQLDVRKWCFGFFLIVESGNAKFNRTEVKGYRNASSRFTSSLNITPNTCLSSFMTETAFRTFLVFFNPMSRLTFLIGSWK